MPRPLQYGDPSSLGPFSLQSCVFQSVAGFVYLGVDPQGRPVSVALLTRGAADDAAARDRFRAEITPEMLPPTAPAPPDPAPGEPSPVVAANIAGEAPWVATLHNDGSAGAERFLEPVMLRRRWAGRRGPAFQPYWIGSAVPALEPPPVPPERVPDNRGLIAALITLAALLAVLILLLVLLFACDPDDDDDPKPTPTPTPTFTPPPPPPPPTPTPSPSPTKKSPSPSPSKTTQTPGTGEGGGEA